MHMLYLTAGLGLARVDFSGVSPAVLSLHLYGSGGSWLWYRVQHPKSQWPNSEVELLSDHLIQ